jgi:lysophospholipase L1-like esterase
MNFTSYRIMHRLLLSITTGVLLLACKAGSDNTQNNGGGQGGDVSSQTGAGAGGRSETGGSAAGEGGKGTAGSGGSTVTGWGGMMQGQGGTVSGTGGSGGGVIFDPCPPQGTACKIMPLGDSITEAYQYRVLLFGKAIAANRLMTYVGGSSFGPATVDGVPFPKQHEGHSGYMVDGIVGLIDASLTAHKPHIVLLMIGTNDAHRSSSVATAPKRVGTMLDSMFTRDPNLLIVVAKIIPSQENPNTAFFSVGNNERVKTFNAAMGTEVEARQKAGKHLVLVDMYQAFTANPSYQSQLMNDNLHPNAAGYRLMADVWWAAIEPWLK